ncbi:MAG: hypothetical protein Q4D48_08310 [Coriobacteriales bacterium]|nr:hypothetical protein [Coriobacteriales bacterium]
MKKLIALAFTASLVCASPLVLTACEKQGGNSPAGTSTSTEAVTEQVTTGQFATLGDVLAADTQSMTSTFDEQNYVCAFELDGKWWRIEAALPEGMSNELDEAWMTDQDKVNELLTPLAVTKAETLVAPSANELAAFAGKTGANLTADGFTFVPYTLVVNGSETDCVATKGDYDYLITFDGIVTDEDTDNPAGAVADLTVTTVAIQGVSWTVLTSA